jgi:hypothetical protein
MEWILALPEGDGDDVGLGCSLSRSIGLGEVGELSGVEFGWTRGSPPGYVNLFTNAYDI